MSLTENSREALEVQVREARSRMLWCRVMMAAVFALFISVALAMAGQDAMILILFVPVAAAVAALGNAYATAEEQLSESATALQRLDRIDRLR